MKLADVNLDPYIQKWIFLAENNVVVNGAQLPVLPVISGVPQVYYNARSLFPGVYNARSLFPWPTAFLNLH